MTFSLLIQANGSTAKYAMRNSCSKFLTGNLRFSKRYCWRFKSHVITMRRLICSYRRLEGS